MPQSHLFRLTLATALGLTTPALAEGLSYPVAGTGQTQCYDTAQAIACPKPGAPFSGQDAQHPGPALRYQDNGDGTVTDLTTGLMWEQGFQRARWAESPDRAAAARTGGHQDWRVPTIKELYSLMMFDGQTGRSSPNMTSRPQDARPYLDTTAFRFDYPTQGRYIDAQYITSTAYGGVTMGRDRSFFGVNFADGRIKAYPQNGGPSGRDFYLRLVRGAPEYGHNALHDNGNGTITDQATGLMWMKNDSGASATTLGWTKHHDGSLDWAEALQFCGSLSLSGHQDWRLPNAKELQSIVDYHRSPQVTRSAALDPLFGITAIQDEGGKRNWPFFWSSTTHLDGPQPGTFAVYVAFGEALGSFGNRQGPGDGQGGGQGGARGPGLAPPGMGPPPGGPPGMMPPEPPRGQGQPPGPGPEQMAGSGQVMDVHGAGAQRSSPKTDQGQTYPRFMGPQGDALRIYNYARCVRTAAP